MSIRNLKVLIAYNGAAYHGFQRQPNANTIQEVLETALFKLLGSETPVTGCSRTDAGVHAREFCFNARTASAIPNDGFVAGVNALLPRDIAALSCEDVPDGFHARYSSKGKEYGYLINRGGVRDVFMKDLAFHYYRAPKIDIELMRQAAELFIGKHDFSAYCKAESLEAVRSRKRGAVREIYDFRIKEYDGGRGDYMEFVVKGDGFLHNMVRIMAGTLIYVGEGKRSLGAVKASLSGGNRQSAGMTLPPEGLYLNKVYYYEQ